MKVSLLSDLLQKKLSFLNHAVSPRAQLPILLNLLLETRDGELVISGTDLEISIESTIASEITEEGAVTVPARILTELISSLPKTEISLETINNNMIIKSKHTLNTLPTLPKEDFPKLYEERGLEIASVNSKEFKADLQMVTFASGIDTARPALSGILVKRDKDGFLLVATDGYRLSLKKHKLTTESKITTEESLLVPSRVFREATLLKDEAEEMKILINNEKNQIMFEAGESLLLGRLIASEFPPYEKIIPSDFSATVKFEREEMLKAVKICSIFARDSANIITFSLRKDKIIVSSGAENKVEIEASLTGEENEIAFNAKYLNDFLSNIEENSLVFEMVGPLNPGVFRLQNNESYLHLIMPIRVQG